MKRWGWLARGEKTMLYKFPSPRVGSVFFSQGWSYAMASWSKHFGDLFSRV